MSKLIKPVAYDALLDMKQTEQGIKLIKEFFQQKPVYRAASASCYGSAVRVAGTWNQ